MAAAYDSGRGEIFVADLNTNNVSVVSDVTNTVVATVAVGTGPTGVAYDSGRGEVFVANSGSNNVSVISDMNNTVVASVPVGLFPQGVVYDSGKAEVFVADNNEDNVSVISDATNTVVSTIRVGSYPQGVTYDSGKGEVFVTNSNSDNVSVISDASNSVVRSTPVGTTPYGAAYDSGTAEVFVADNNANNVSVIADRNNTVVATLPVGSYPNGMAYDSGRAEVFVTNFNSNNVSVLSDTNDTVVANLPVGSVPYGVAYDSGNAYVYACDYNGGSVTIISDGSPRTYGVTFSESGLPPATNWSVSLNGSTRNSTSGSIVFAETNGTYAYTVGGLPGFTAVPRAGTLTVNGSSVSQPISFTVTTYAMTFGESGLPSGTNWSVTLNGSAASSTNSTIRFTEPNGTFRYSVGYVPGYTPVPTSGNVTVNGSSVNQSIAFARTTYGVTFSESGLPTGTNWSVSLNGSTESTATSAIVFIEPNGTYLFTVGLVAGFTALPRSGVLTVNGSSVSQPIAFTVTTYAVTFVESGLPSGTNWSVALNGSTRNSTTGTIAAVEPNGTYSYRIGLVPGYSATPASGNLTVNGSPVSQPIVFAVPTYALTFTESGLPSGTAWSVTLNGTLHSSTTTTIALSEPNGTYSFVVGSVVGFAASPRSGPVNVSGGPVAQAIAFVSTVPGQFAVTFTESGLPSGTSWTVTLNGTPRTSTSSAVTFSQANGSYPFTIGSTAGYRPSPSEGNVSVRGAAVSQPVAFAPGPPEYAVTFTATGLPSGTNWSVMLGATTLSSHGGGSVSFQAANGTYTYSIGPVPGYQPSPSGGGITVQGQAVNVTVSFSSTSGTSPSPLGLSLLDWGIIAAVIALAIGLLVALVLRRRSKKPTPQSEHAGAPR